MPVVSKSRRWRDGGIGLAIGVAVAAAALHLHISDSPFGLSIVMGAVPAIIDGMETRAGGPVSFMPDYEWIGRERHQLASVRHLYAIAIFGVRIG